MVLCYSTRFGVVMVWGRCPPVARCLPGVMVIYSFGVGGRGCLRGFMSKVGLGAELACFCVYSTRFGVVMVWVRCTPGCALLTGGYCCLTPSELVEGDVCEDVFIGPKARLSRIGSLP